MIMGCHWLIFKRAKYEFSFQCLQVYFVLRFPGGTRVKNPPANAADVRDIGSTPGSGRSSGGGHGNPPQYSRLENPTNREAWEAIVHGVTKSWTGLKRLNTHTL